MNNLISYEIDSKVINVFVPSKDDLTKVLLDLKINSYYEVNQIHSNLVHIVDDKYQNKLDGDAMITNIPYKALVIKTADCMPILAYDRKNRVIGTVHSGWKGTLNNIIGVTLNKMINEFNSNPTDIEIYLYPYIKQCHFEIKEDVYNQFSNRIKNIAEYTKTKDDKYYLDLLEIVVKDALDKGIKKENITDHSVCTYCYHEIFKSYRYNQTSDRNYLLVMLKD